MIGLSNKIIAFGLTLVFFMAGLLTLPHYGVNWDAISHLSRGQAFLYYYLTGENNYSNLKDWRLYQEKEASVKKGTAQDNVPRQRLYFQNPDTIFFSPDIPKNEIPRISIYQNAGDVFKDIKTRYEFGHPHISDVLSSVFNYVLFQKLGLLNDIDSYRVYGVLLSSLLVGLVFWWTAHSYGKFAGIIAALSLSFYPLFLAESHFNNEKDIPETVYWTFMLFSLWCGITAKSWKWILASGVFFGLALGTKFNILFSIFVILPWLVFYLASHYRGKFSARKFFKKHASLIFAALVAPFLGVFIIVRTWPDFWQNPLHKITRIVDFYTTIGTTADIDERFIGPFGINAYAVQWIFYTTPLVILFLAFVGFFAILSRRFQDRQKVSLLFLLWLAVPILRVTWPGTNIYGGVRQIMEFIPAMAIIAGIGGSAIVVLLNGYITKWVKQKWQPIRLLQVLVVLAFIPIVIKLIQIHPNENVYFNPLIGGLPGAKARDFPGWGVSFGAPYREAIAWINQNAEPGATLTLGTEISSNVPAIFIRPDIIYGSKRSGYLMRGEYVISLRFQGAERRSYFDMYLDRMIEPLHEITVDGVAILKIWKNDKEHLKPEWSNEVVLNDIKFTKNDSMLAFDVGDVVKLSRLELTYNNDDICPELSWGYFMISKDGREWERVPGVLPEEVRSIVLGIQPKDGNFIEPFVGQEARYINFFVSPEDACVAQVENVRLYHF